MNLFPFVSFERVASGLADRALITWGHYLGENDRPFGRQDFGLYVHGELVSVAVSASTVGATCASFSRFEVVELARLVTRPGDRAFTRVTLRLWRQIAADEWRRTYRDHWHTVKAVVSYSNETRHKGDIYRFDGWKKFGIMPGSTGGGTYTKPQLSEPKAVWFYELGKVA